MPDARNLQNILTWQKQESEKTIKMN